MPSRVSISQPIYFTAFFKSSEPPLWSALIRYLSAFPRQLVVLRMVDAVRLLLRFLYSQTINTSSLPRPVHGFGRKSDIAIGLRDARFLAASRKPPIDFVKEMNDVIEFIIKPSKIIIRES